VWDDGALARLPQWGLGGWMKDPNQKIDREKAYLNPAEVFASPEDVVEYAGLSREAKIEILRRWSYEAAELSVAEEEGMGGGEPNLTDRIYRCLHELDAEIETGTAGLTKHGSIPAPARR
jgi:hypothetical protein